MAGQVCVGGWQAGKGVGIRRNRTFLLPPLKITIRQARQVRCPQKAGKGMCVCNGVKVCCCSRGCRFAKVVCRRRRGSGGRRGKVRML